MGKESYTHMFKNMPANDSNNSDTAAQTLGSSESNTTDIPPNHSPDPQPTATDSFTP